VRLRVHHIPTTRELSAVPAAKTINILRSPYSAFTDLETVLN